ncbi:hypothetical protein [Streptococcus oralis]|uniref:Uncharacterized protein n=1 Tax=Streptococcus oralis TaxID=1303 RepID=A0A428CAT4_STROR|nr:hypothetical protein [Streptococcus oralis]RSI75087.1 hypothetical protein D8858_07045 [Streptococcus oralis]
MCEKIRIRIVSDYPSIRGGLEDILIMENMTNDLILVQIRVNGYLLDFASIEGQRQKHHRLQNIPQEVLLTVDEVEEDVDLTLHENRSYKEADFLNTCFRRIAKHTFKDLQLLSFFMREDSFLV